MHIRAEHILAILVTGIFLLVDIAVLCFFVTAFDAEPQLVRSHTATTHGYVTTPELDVATLTRATLGGSTETKAEAVKHLEEILSEQLQALTQTKTAP